MGEFEVLSGSPLALALVAARAAAERADMSTMDVQYRYAVRHAHDLSAELRVEVAVEHVGALRAAGDSRRSLQRGDEYTRRYGKDLRLLLTCAETRLTIGDYSRIDADLATVRDLGGGGPAENALSQRLEGLAAAHYGRFPDATRLFKLSQDAYRDLGEEEAVAVLAEDIRAVAARQGKPTTEEPTGTRTANSRLTRAEELRVCGRYEEALGEVEQGLAGETDPARRFFYLEALVRLLLLLRDHDRADELMVELYEAAEATAQPTRARETARRLDRFRLEPLALDGFEHVRWLIADGQLAAAQDLLLTTTPPADPATWNLAAAELLMATAGHPTTDEDECADLARRAVDQCEQCLRVPDSPITVRLTALRLLGHAYERCDKGGSHVDLAVAAWRGAHQLEESLAALQPSDKHRLRMLRAARSEFDEWIDWAAGRAEDLVVLAMEAAKGAALQVDGSIRKLPEPDDRKGAHRWIRRAARRLPRSQVVWMLHATPGAVHHVFLERTLRGIRIRHHVAAEVTRNELIATIESMAACWSDGGARRLAGAHREFDRLLGNVARQLGIAGLPGLPGHVKRIAVVAGGELAEIPFALLPWPGTTGTLIGRRYAVSALPSLSLRRPLHRRSRRQRGTGRNRMLLLHGPGDMFGELQPARALNRRALLIGADSTAERLREELHTGRYRQVRLDCHGKFGDAAAAAALLLAPGDPAGWLGADELRAMNLTATGTLLLGACESGMVERIGRDEHDGFVRAGLAAGASAVLAARWEAQDAEGARIVDRFERNLRGYPRDLALFHAQQGIDGHPSIWAAWTVYGAADHQTRRGPLSRWIHRRLAVRHWGERKA